MRLPDNSDNFVDSVLSDSKRLIALGLWDIRTVSLDSWLNQFCGREEKFFAACILDQLIFRTSQQFESDLCSLFRGGLNRALCGDAHDLKLAMSLAGRSDPKLRLIPVICESDPPTKSGPLVLRRLQRLLKIQDRWMCWPWQVPEQVDKNGVDSIIFVDDILGTGSQFEDFYAHWEFSNITKKINYYYVPVVAHRKGIDKLSESLPSVQVITAEVLENIHSFFSEDTWQTLGKGNITAQEALDWYTKFATNKGIVPRKIGILGVGDLALNFSFNHATPNNSLPILWYSGNGWNPLLER